MLLFNAGVSHLRISESLLIKRPFWFCNYGDVIVTVWLLSQLCVLTDVSTPFVLPVKIAEAIVAENTLWST